MGCVEWLKKLIETFENLDAEWDLNFFHAHLHPDGRRTPTKEEVVFSLRSRAQWLHRQPRMVQSTIDSYKSGDRGFACEGVHIYCHNGGIYSASPFGQYFIHLADKHKHKGIVFTQLPHPHELGDGKYKVDRTLVSFESDRLPVHVRRCAQCHKGVVDRTTRMGTVKNNRQVPMAIAHLSGEHAFCDFTCAELYCGTKNIPFAKTDYGDLYCIHSEIPDTDDDTLRYEARLRKKQFKVEKQET